MEKQIITLPTTAFLFAPNRHIDSEMSMLPKPTLQASPPLSTHRTTTTSRLQRTTKTVQSFFPDSQRISHQQGMCFTIPDLYSPLQQTTQNKFTITLNLSISY